MLNLRSLLFALFLFKSSTGLSIQQRMVPQRRSSCPFVSAPDAKGEQNNSTPTKCPFTKATNLLSGWVDNLATATKMATWSANEMLNPQDNKDLPFISDGKPPLGFAGDLFIAGSDQVSFFESKFREGEIRNAKGYVSTLGGVPFMVLADTNSMKYLLRERPHGFERAITSTVPKDVGMGIAGGGVWRRQRKCLASSFREKEVQRVTKRIEEIAKQVADEVQRQNSNNQAVDFRHMCSIMAMSVAAKSVGLNVNLAKDGCKNYHLLPFFSDSFEDFRVASADLLNDPFQSLLAVKLPSLSLAALCLPKYRKAITAMQSMLKFPEEYVNARKTSNFNSVNGIEFEDSVFFENLLTMDDENLIASALGVVGFFNIDSSTSQMM